jgi:hypothetical protein
MIGHMNYFIGVGIDDWACELLYWCWQSDPATRPSFEEILSYIKIRSSSKFVRGLAELLLKKP